MLTLQERRSGLPQERGKQGVFASAREAGSKVKEATACDSIYIIQHSFLSIRAVGRSLREPEQVLVLVGGYPPKNRLV